MRKTKKSLPGDVAHHPPSGSSGYLKPKLQALRIPIAFTMPTNLSQRVAKNNKISFWNSKIYFFDS
jgi:hypothetical protein